MCATYTDESFKRKFYFYVSTWGENYILLRKHDDEAGKGQMH